MSWGFSLVFFLCMPLSGADRLNPETIKQLVMPRVVILLQFMQFGQVVKVTQENELQAKEYCRLYQSELIKVMPYAQGIHFPSLCQRVLADISDNAQELFGHLDLFPWQKAVASTREVDGLEVSELDPAEINLLVIIIERIRIVSESINVFPAIAEPTDMRA